MVADVAPREAGFAVLEVGVALWAAVVRGVDFELEPQPASPMVSEAAATETSVLLLARIISSLVARNVRRRNVLGHFSGPSGSLGRRGCALDGTM